MLANRNILVIAFISTYRDPLTTLCATCITCGTVIWCGNKTAAGMDAIKGGLVGTKDGIIGIKDDIVRIRTDIADSKKELKADIDGVKKELSQVELRLASNCQYGQGISVGSAYAMMKCLSSKRQMKSQWMGDIAKGARFDGEDCAPTKAAGEAKKG